MEIEKISAILLNGHCALGKINTLLDSLHKYNILGGDEKEMNLSDRPCKRFRFLLGSVLKVYTVYVYE